MTNADPMRFVTGCGLALEPQVAAHADAMFLVLGDPAIYEYENEPPSSLEWLRARFARLESRRAPGGDEQWLNWVIRLPASELVGYVQATIHPGGRAAIAYVLASRHWGRGLATQAVQAMIRELGDRHGVVELSAVLKRRNVRSLRLLERLGFAHADPATRDAAGAEEDELLMVRPLRTAQGLDPAHPADQRTGAEQPQQVDAGAPDERRRDDRD
jgi:[ribosomal protein S5]-alanine N-acetyltransferase